MSGEVPMRWWERDRPTSTARKRAGDGETHAQGRGRPREGCLHAEVCMRDLGRHREREASQRHGKTSEGGG